MTYPSNGGGVAQDQLRSIVERIERLREEIGDLNKDVSEVYKEARGNGFDVPTLKALVSERAKAAKDPAAYQEREALLDLYRHVVGTGTAPEKAIDKAAEKRNVRVRAHEPREMTLSQVRQSLKSGIIPNQDFRFDGGVVYFALWRDVGRIKVGVTNNVARRISDIEASIGASLEVLGTISGNRAAEIECHKRLAQFSIRNEWFNATEDCIAIIETILNSKIDNSIQATKTPEATVKGEADGTLPRTASANAGSASNLHVSTTVEPGFNSNPATSSPPETGGDAASSSLASSPTNSPAARPIAGEGTHPTDDKERGDAVRGKGSPDGEVHMAVKSPHGAHKSNDFDPVRDMPAHLRR